MYQPPPITEPCLLMQWVMIFAKIIEDSLNSSYKTGVPELSFLQPLHTHTHTHTHTQIVFHISLFNCLQSSSHSVQFSRSILSNSLGPHEPQHIRPPYPSTTPKVYSNPCPLSRWCHPTISFSVILFSSCLQSFPASGSFQISQLFTSGGQSTGVSASTSVLPVNTQDWSPLGWTGWISLQSKGLSRIFSNTTVQKHQFFCIQLSL